jgi:phosphatidylglycerophosphatase C
MTTGSQVVVAVDLDGTLTDRDCFTRFLRFELGWARLFWFSVRSLLPLTSSLLRGSRNGAKAVLSSWLEGRSQTELELSARRFAQTHISHWLREDISEPIEALRREGARVVIVSASYDLYVSEVGAMIGAEAALATQLEFVDGWCTGRLATPNCRGEEKVRRLSEWLEQNCSTSEEVRVVAYGDSSGDDAMLAFANEGVRVERRRRWVR